MKQNCRIRTKAEFKLIIFLILVAITISVYIIIYGGCNAYNYYGADTSSEVKAITTSEVEAEAAFTIRANTSQYDIYKSNHENTTQNLFLVFSWDAIPTSRNLQTIFFVIFISFFLILFLFLPDDWTLVNQKVRLDD